MRDALDCFREATIRSVPSVGPWMVQEFRQAEGFLRTLPIGPHRFMPIFADGGSYNVQEKNAEWFGGKSVTIMGTTITDEFMGECHRRGWAHEYDRYGTVRRKLTGDGDFGVPDKTLILTRPGR